MISLAHKMDLFKSPQSITKYAFLAALGWIFFFGFVAMTAVVSSLDQSKQPPSQIEILGQMGDSFGIFSSAITSLTLAGAFFTVVLQRQAMSKQEKDHHTQLKAARELHSLEQRRSHTEFRLHKLECITLAVLNMKTKTGTLIDMARREDTFEAAQIIHSIFAAYSESNALAMLYFPSIEDKLRKLKELIVNYSNIIDERNCSAEAAFQHFGPVSEEIDHITALCLFEAGVLNVKHGEFSYAHSKPDAPD